MLRPKPLPADELKIAKRVQQWRKMAAYSRVGLAALLGVDSSLLARVEHGRTPVTYRLAWLLCCRAQLNPAWLRTGEGRPFASAPLVAGETFGLTGNELFSRSFDDHLVTWLGDKQEWSNTVLALIVEPSIDGRLVAQRWIESEVERWLEVVPDAELDEFVNKLCAHGNNAVASYGLDSVHVREKRRKEMEERRGAVQARRQLLQQTTATSKLEVDTSKARDMVAPANSEIPNWKQLVKDLKRLTSAPRAKSQLANDLETTRQNVNKWLSGAGAPSAELTLKVLRWVREHGGA